IRSKTSRERVLWKTLPVMWRRRKRSQWWRSSAHWYGTDILRSRDRALARKLVQGGAKRHMREQMSQVASTALEQEPKKKQDSELKPCYNSARRNHHAPLPTASSATKHERRLATQGG